MSRPGEEDDAVALVRVYCGLASADETVRSASAGALLTVAVVDDAGRLLGVHEISDDPAGYAQLGRLLVERTSGFTDAAVAADSDDHLVTSLLSAAGRPLVVTDDDSADDYAERFADDDSVEEMEAPPAARRAVGLARALQAGAIAAVNVPATRELTSYKPVLAAHVAMLTGRQAAAVALREVLRELYPAALRAYPDPAHPLALAVLDALPEPGRLTSRGNDPDQMAEDVAAELTRAGAGTEDQVVAAVTALTVAISESPRRGGVNKSLAPAAADAVRQAIGAVRSCDSACESLVGTLAARVSTPVGAGRRTAGSRRAAEPTVVQARPLDTTPRIGRRSRPEPSAGNAPVIPHPLTSPPVAPEPVMPPPLAPRPVTPPPLAPAASLPPASLPPASRPPASLPAAASLPSRTSTNGPGNRPVSVPPPPPGMTPITPGSRPVSSPAPSFSPPPAYPPSPSFSSSPSFPQSPTFPSSPSFPSSSSGSADSFGGPSDTGAYRSLRDTGLPSRTSGFSSDSGHGLPSRSGGDSGLAARSGADTGLPSRSASDPGLASRSASDSGLPPRPPADAGQPFRPTITNAAMSSARAERQRTIIPPRPNTRNGQPPAANGATDYSLPMPGQRPAQDQRQPEMPEPGSRANWPLLNSDDQLAALPPAPLSPAPGAISGPPADGRVRPPWQDMPSEPPALRLVGSDLSGLANVAADVTAITEPPPLRLVDRDGRPGRSPRRTTLTALDRSTQPPVPAEGDGDLLIFAAARSAWFTGPADESNELDWTNPNDTGWRAAEKAATPAVAAETSAGLPKRVPQANLVPGSPMRDERPLRIVRDAASIAAHTTGYFRGWRRGQEIGGYAIGGRPGRESAGGWDFSRDGQAEDYRNNAGYRSS